MNTCVHWSILKKKDFIIIFTRWKLNAFGYRCGSPWLSVAALSASVEWNPSVISVESLLSHTSYTHTHTHTHTNIWSFHITSALLFFVALHRLILSAPLSLQTIFLFLSAAMYKPCLTAYYSQTHSPQTLHFSEPLEHLPIYSTTHIFSDTNSASYFLKPLSFHSCSFRSYS